MPRSSSRLVLLLPGPLESAPCQGPLQGTLTLPAPFTCLPAPFTYTGCAALSARGSPSCSFWRPAALLGASCSSLPAAPCMAPPLGISWWCAQLPVLWLAVTAVLLTCCCTTMLGFSDGWRLTRGSLGFATLPPSLPRTHRPACFAPTLSGISAPPHLLPGPLLLRRPCATWRGGASVGPLCQEGLAACSYLARRLLL